MMNWWYCVVVIALFGVIEEERINRIMNISFDILP